MLGINVKDTNCYWFPGKSWLYEFLACLSSSNNNRYFLYSTNLFNMLYFESIFSYWINFPSYDLRLDVCMNEYSFVCMSEQKCNQKILWEKKRKKREKSENYQFIPIIINIWRKKGSKLWARNIHFPLVLLWIIVDSYKRHKPKRE